MLVFIFRILYFVKRFFIILAIFAAVGIAGVCLINLQVASYAQDRIYCCVDTTPAGRPVAIILGARVGKDGQPSNTLYDRVLTGVELYKAGKVNKLLLSGGNDEPEVMRKLAIELGVSATDVALDTFGLRTYDTCIRAKQVFEVDKAIVVTQDYHLYRTLYLCKNVGVDAIGVDAKRRDYDGEKFLWLREYFSRVAAWFDINFRSPPPEPQEKHPFV
jgi:SanA protein